jgi:hypothetical protein
MTRETVPDPMRDAFRKRLHEAAEHLADSADQETVARALGMADALSGMGFAIQRVATADSAGLRDPLAPARARGIAARERLIERSGGLLRLGEAAERLGVTVQAVTGRRSRDTILAVPLPNGEWVYPACQFGDAGLIDGIDAFVRAFEDADPWTRLAVLLAPSARYGGVSDLELLEAGRTEEARAIAGTWGDHG